MRKTMYSNDSRLWSYLIDEFRAAGVKGSAALEHHARRAVSIVRNQRDHASVVSWGPGEEIPADVVWVYDLDGDVWDREPGGLWTMRDFDPDEVEGAAGGQYVDETLLARYGPVTGTPRDEDEQSELVAMPNAGKAVDPTR